MDHTEQLKKFAKNYWDSLNVDELQPVFHGPEPTEEQRLLAKQQMDKINELAKIYREANNIPEKNDILYPDLEDMKERADE